MIVLVGTVLTTALLWVLSRGAQYVWAMIFNKPSELVTLEEKVPNYITTDFSGWSPTGKINDLVVTDGQTFTLSEEGYKRQANDKKNRPTAVRDPQGYIQSPQELSENSFVCSKIISRTEQIDFTTRLNHKLQVITGDGDDQTVGLKLVTGDSEQYQAPDPPPGLAAEKADPNVDDQGRYHLERKMPTNESFITCLTVNAPRGEKLQTVTITLVVLDDIGNVLDLGRMPTWTVHTPSEINGSNRFSIGLIDSRNRHPVVEVRGFCAIEMLDKGNVPSDREKAACLFP